MYVNDAWYALFPVQLLFTLTDDVALLLRFCNALPEVRAAIHSCHLLFLFTIESEPLSHGRTNRDQSPFSADCDMSFDHGYVRFEAVAGLLPQMQPQECEPWLKCGQQINRQC